MAMDGLMSFISILRGEANGIFRGGTKILMGVGI
jgi:hypothetical protein